MPGKLGSSWIGPSKVCPRCHIEKDRVKSFGMGPSAPWGRSYCTDCQKRWFAIHHEEVRSHRLDLYLRRNYGITLNDYEMLWEKQNGRCAICKVQAPVDARGSTAKLHVDHDHVTGEVRSLLCYACNKSLGFLEKVGYQKVAQYLHG